MTTRKAHLLLFIVITLFEAMLFATVFSGWSVYIYILIDRGFYSSLCSRHNYTLSNEFFQNVSNSTTNRHINENGVTIATTRDNNRTAPSEIILDAKMTSCKEQQEQLNLLYTISIALIQILVFIWGFLSYKFGFCRPKVISMVVFICGALILSFVTPDTALLIIPGLTCIGLGGFSVLVFNTKVTTYLPFGTAIYSALLTGAGNSSVITFRIVKRYKIYMNDFGSAIEPLLLYDSGISDQIAFIGIAILHFVIASTSTLFHWKFNQWHDKSLDIEIEIQTLSKQTQVKEGKSRKRGLSNAGRKKTLQQSVCRSLTFTHLMWFSILLTTRIMYIGTINERLDERVPDEVSYYTDIMSYVMFGGILTSFIPGVLAEWQRKLSTGGDNLGREKMKQQVLTLLITSLLAIILSTLQFSSLETIFYLEFVVLTIFTSFLFASSMTFIISVNYCISIGFVHESISKSQKIIDFDNANRGRGNSYGCMEYNTYVNGVVSTMQYGLFRWYNMYPEAQLHVGFFVTSLTVITLIHPINVFLHAKRDGKEVVNMCFKHSKSLIHSIKQNKMEITRL